jgi:aspartyl-tRNA(Asn)/glutamyl-tRNA(Gln) amidotransferase subunit A
VSTLPSNPCDASLVEIAAALKSGAVSSVEVTEASLARLATAGQALTAVVGCNPDDALRQAAAADASPKSAALAGVPLAHKDMFYRPGRLSECGSKVRQGFMPDILSGALKKLDQAGALDIARLNMAEFAFGVTGHNEATGDACNPWNPAHMTGGSSSGSAAMVAARATFGALGSDTGGSVRLPAACCGIVGMNVTMGRVSRFGAMPLSYTLDTIGPLTRTVSDNALMLSQMAGHDPDDPSSVDVAVDDYLGALEGGVKGLKIGLPKSHFMDGMTAELEAMFAAAVAVLKKSGAIFVDVDLPDAIRYTNALTSLITATEGAALHQHWMETRGDLYGAQTFGRLAGGLATPASRYIQALELRTEVLAAFNECVFRNVDVMMTPMMIMDVPTREESDVRAGPNAAEMLSRIGHCSRPINFLGLPGLSVPSGFTKAGLPSSLQFVGRPFDEATLYRVGRAYERETEWYKTAPDESAWSLPK